MSDVTLYFCPGACSRVTLNALEEVRIPFEGRPVNLFKGEQKSPDYLAVNPKGKVPALVMDGELFTETPAILLHLHRLYPEAKLLPGGDLPLQALSDLAWLASTLHPIVGRIRSPQRFTAAGADEVKANAEAAMAQELDGIAGQLSKQPFWYGEHWSIVDVYIYWMHFAVEPVGFSIDRWPALQAHAEAVRARPAFQRARDREKTGAAAIGMDLPPSF